METLQHAVMNRTPDLKGKRKSLAVTIVPGKMKAYQIYQYSNKRMHGMLIPYILTTQA